MPQALLSPAALPDACAFPDAPASPGAMAGIDEAGRGCLAGPVVAAAVTLPESYSLPGLTDSKALTAPQREALALGIRQCALAWGLGVVWQKDIDRINILQATFLAMGRAVACLGRAPRPFPALLLVDGNKTIPRQVLAGCLDASCRPPTPDGTASADRTVIKPATDGSRGTGGSGTLSLPRQKALVGGDALEPCISAASILAKTFRDRLMDALHKRYPLYGFLQHKGYGTREHMAALLAHGPCPLHRLTFRGVLPETAPRKPAQGALL